MMLMHGRRKCNKKYGKDYTSGDHNDVTCDHDEVNAVILMHAMMVKLEVMLLHAVMILHVYGNDDA